MKRMLSPDECHKFFSAFAKLPLDAFESVTCLYECLLYMASQNAPEASWKF